MEINNIATKGDIESLKSALSEIKSLLEHNPNQKAILRSADVRKLLNISDGTLQRLRISGELKGRKIQGTWFYNLKDIMYLFSK